LLLLVLALNNIKQRRILGNLGQLVGLLRLVTINCRCIPEDNNEVEQLLEKKR